MKERPMCRDCLKPADFLLENDTYLCAAHTRELLRLVKSPSSPGSESPAQEALPSK